MAITCGRIRRPFGASLSMGTTSTATSPGGTRSATMPAVVEEVRRRQPQQRLAQRRRRPRPSGRRPPRRAPQCRCRRARSSVGERPRVDLVDGDDDGHLAPRRVRATRPSSKAPHAPASVTTTPRSTRSSTARVRCHAQLAERALVVHAGGVDEQHRARAAAAPSASRPDPSWCRRRPRRWTPAGA